MAGLTVTGDLVKWAGKEVSDEGGWFERGVGSIAGGTLGFLEGNIPGAAAGASLGYELGKKGYGKKATRWFGETANWAMGKRKTGKTVGSFSPNMKRTYQTPWAPIKRQKTGIQTGKRINRRTKKRRGTIKASKKLNRKVNKKIKSVVKRVLECDFNQGVYTKAWTGMYSFGVTTVDTQIVVDSVQRDDNNLGGFTVEALQLSPFSSLKLLDASSVLFNGKAKAINYEETTGNWPAPKALKLNVNYASYCMTMVNNSDTVYDIDLYRGYPKEDQNDDLLTTWENNISNNNWVGGVPAITTMNQSPGMVDAVGRKWNTKVTSFKFRPGDSKKFFTTFKGCVDFDKHYRSGSVLQKYMKGISESWMIVAKIGLNMQSTAAVGDATRCSGVGNKQWGISFEFNEVYKIQEPDDTLDANQGDKRVFYVNYPVVPDYNSTISRFSSKVNLYTANNIT